MIVKPLVDVPVTLSPVGVPSTVVTAAAWFDALDVPPVLFATSVNGPYDVAPDRPVIVYEVGFVP